VALKTKKLTQNKTLDGLNEKIILNKGKVG
jgi:hypothetical protein